MQFLCEGFRSASAIVRTEAPRRLRSELDKLDEALVFGDSTLGHHDAAPVCRS
jgi:hypothetical protein